MTKGFESNTQLKESDLADCVNQALTPVGQYFKLCSIFRRSSLGTMSFDLSKVHKKLG